MLESIKEFRNQLVELHSNYDVDLRGVGLNDGKVVDAPSAGSALVANNLYNKIPSNI